jgi:lipopolysaccharide exporter
MARMLPKSDIGIWVLFTSVASILEMIRNGFIRNPFITHLVAAEEEDKKNIVTSSFILHCLLSLFVTAFLIFGAAPLADFWNATGLAQLFYIYAVNNLIFILYHHFEYIQVAKSKFNANFFSNVFRLGLFAIYIIILFVFKIEVTLVDLAIMQTITTFLGCFVAYYFVRESIEYSKIVDWKLVKELFHFGKFTFGTNISSMFVKNTDSWMIGRMISTAGVAIYNPAVRISNLVEVPTLAIANVLFPQVTKRMKENGNEGVRDIYIKSVSLILAITIPMAIPIYIFPDLVVTVIFGKEYLDASPILRVTLFYTLIIPFNRQFGTVMDGIKKPRLNFYLLIMVAILNLVFNFYFLSTIGVIGAAYATLLSYCIVFILNQIILYRMFKINTFSVFVNIFNWYKVGWEIFSKRVLKLA